MVNHSYDLQKIYSSILKFRKDLVNKMEIMKGSLWKNICGGKRIKGD